MPPQIKDDPTKPERPTIMSAYQNLLKQEKLEVILSSLRAELLSAMAKHAPMHSPHEGHSVIREEVDELWDHVKADTGQTPEARKEALQVAAMGIRYVLDLCDDAE